MKASLRCVTSIVVLLGLLGAVSAAYATALPPGTVDADVININFGAGTLQAQHRPKANVPARSSLARPNHPFIHGGLWRQSVGVDRGGPPDESAK